MTYYNPVFKYGDGSLSKTHLLRVWTASSSLTCPLTRLKES